MPLTPSLGSEVIFGILVAMSVSWLAVPLVRRAALRLGVVDLPGARRTHEFVTPRLGGLGIFTGILAAIVVSKLMGVSAALLSPPLLAVVVGAPLALLIGLWDDVWSLGSRRKFIAQLLLGVIAYAVGFRIEVLSFGVGYEFPLGIWALPATVLWISAVMNAVNLVDGLDGLAGGVSAIAMAGIGLMAYYLGNREMVWVCAISIGAVLGFLRHNFSSAKIFMGDSGSMLLGFLLAVTSLSVVPNGIGRLPIHVALFFFAFPVVDMSVAILRRGIRSAYAQKYMQSAGLRSLLVPMLREIFSADGDHIHHRLLTRGFSHRQVTLIVYGLSVVTVGLSFLLLVLPAPFTWIFAIAALFGIRHMVLALDYAEFSHASLRERQLAWEEDLGDRPVILRRVS